MKAHRLVPVLAVAALVACGSPSGQPLPSTTAGPTTTSGAATSEGTTPATVTVTATGASHAAAVSATACDTPGLRVSAGTVEAGAGQRYVPLVLTNTGSAPCTLRGYPGVAALDAAGNQVGQARRDPGTAATVRLAPGASASALVHATAVPVNAGTCPPDVVALLVTPPDRTTSIRVTVTLPSCGGLDVRTIVPGTTGM